MLKSARDTLPNALIVTKTYIHLKSRGWLQVDNNDIDNLIGVLFTIDNAQLTEEQSEALQTIIDIVDEIRIEGRWS